MAARPCIVSFRDTEGLRHSVEVQAESLYEAALLALKIFQAHNCCPGVNSVIEVDVRTSVTHSVTARKIRDWLEGGARGPAERLLKNRLKELLSDMQI